MDEETEALRGSVELPRVRTESRLWPHLLIPHLFCPLGWENHSFCEYLLSVCYMPGLLANCQKEVPSRVPGVQTLGEGVGDKWVSCDTWEVTSQGTAPQLQGRS